MKNSFQFVTTEGYGNHNYRGMDTNISLKNQNDEIIKVRFDISPKALSQRSYDAECDMQRKLLDGTRIVIFTHSHNDHFGADILEYATEDQKDKIRIVWKDDGNFSPERPKGQEKKYMERKRILDEFSNTILISDETKYFSFKDSGLSFEIRVVDHSCYKGYNLGKVSMVFLENNNKKQNLKIGFSSDVSGPEYDEAKDIICEENPDILFLDGPYNDIFSVFGDAEQQKKAFKALESSYDDLRAVLSKTDSYVVLMHHFLRNCEVNSVTEVKDYLKRRVEGVEKRSKKKEISQEIIDSMKDTYKKISNIMDEISKYEYKIILPTNIESGIVNIDIMRNNKEIEKNGNFRPKSFKSALSYDAFFSQSSQPRRKWFKRG